MSKFFCRPNLKTDAVTVSERPWDDFPVAPEVLDLPKEDYKKRWFDFETKHCLWLLTEGQNPAFCVSVGNQAAALHGFAADYDGVFTPDIIDAMKAKPPSRYRPRYWCVSQSSRLHLVWVFDRPIPVTGNAHAADLIHVIATKIRAVRWGVGYDPDSEKPTQVMDIGRETHEFDPIASVPAEEIVMWDVGLFKNSAKRYVEDAVDVPEDVWIKEVLSRKWPHDPPADLHVGSRCIRFWDPSADNSTAAMAVKDGFRVYTPHDNGFKSVRSLLGRDFCEQYTAKSMAPFYEDTVYDHVKDTYWRFLRNETPPRFVHRTEKVLRRDLKFEANLSDKVQKGQEKSEVEEALYTIGQRNTVDAVATVLFRPAGKLYLGGKTGTVYNKSLVVVRKPAERVASLGPASPLPEGMPDRFRSDPLACEWGNPVAVSGFPHIHRLLTTFFMGRTRAKEWERNGFPVRDQEFMHDHQLDLLVSWVAHFYCHAARMDPHPPSGMVLVLAGPAGTGKSFFAREILGGLMGGAVDADRFYIEGQRFTSDLVDSPVHLVDDKLGSRSHRDRLKFTERLKSVVANRVLPYEEKFGSVCEVPWPGRVVILSNEDSVSLSVLPDLDMSTRDKIMMLKLGNAQYRFDSMNENQKWLAEELPYFARFLLGWRSETLDDDLRFGMVAYQNPVMAQASAENGMTQTLVEVLEACIEETRKHADPKESSDSAGWAFVGNSVQVLKWIKGVDPAFGPEVVDARCLQTNLGVLLGTGGYNIRRDEVHGKWMIPFELRKTGLTPTTEV